MVKAVLKKQFSGQALKDLQRQLSPREWSEPGLPGNQYPQAEFSHFENAVSSFGYLTIPLSSAKCSKIFGMYFLVCLPALSLLLLSHSAYPKLLWGALQLVFSKSKSICYDVFFLEFWNLLCIKTSKYCGNPSVQPKMNLFGIRKRCTPRLSLCIYLWSTPAGRTVGERNFDIFLHFSTAPLFFAFPFWIPKSVLPSSLKACVPSPPMWAVLHLWSGISIMKLQHSKEHCPAFGRISSYPRGLFPHFPTNSL